MPKGRPREIVVLGESEQAELETMLRKRSLGQSVARHANIVLLCAQGLPDLRVAEQVGVTHATVGKWRKRYIEFGIEGLLNHISPIRITHQNLSFG